MLENNRDFPGLLAHPGVQTWADLPFAEPETMLLLKLKVK